LRFGSDLRPIDCARGALRCAFACESRRFAKCRKTPGFPDVFARTRIARRAARGARSARVPAKTQHVAVLRAHADARSERVKQRNLLAEFREMRTIIA
jgi:hypothetical protein